MTEKEAIERGGFESRDVTIDYAKMGLYMKGLNQVSAFTMLEHKVIQKFMKPLGDRPGRAMTMITASIILPSIYFWFANKDNEVYQRQPEWVKKLITGLLLKMECLTEYLNLLILA